MPVPAARVVAVRRVIAGEADIRWIMSGQNAQDFFGLNLNAEGGANFKQFLSESGLSLDQLKNLIPAANKAEADRKPSAK